MPEATRVDINAVDRYGNEATATKYHSSMWGQLAELLGSDDIFSESIALSLGMMSGYTYALIMLPELAAQLIHDFVGTLAIMTVFTLAAMEPVCWPILLLLIGESVIEMQNGENPYDQALHNGLYSSFAGGWYAGFIVMTVLTIWAAQEIASSSVLSDLIAQINLRGGMAKIAGFVTKMGTKAKTILGLFKKTGEEALYSDVEIGAAKAHIWNYYAYLSEAKKAAMSDFKAPLGRFLANTGDDGVFFIEAGGDTTLKQIWSLDSLTGVKSDAMRGLRANLEDACVYNRVSRTQAENIVANLKRLDGVNGLNSVVRILRTAKAPDNFNGVDFQLDRAVRLKEIPGNTVELEVAPEVEPELGPYKIDIKVTNSEGITYYIENKSPFGAIKQLKIRNYLADAQKEFRNLRSDTNDGTTKIEINVQDLGPYTKDTIKTVINNVMVDVLKRADLPNTNMIGEIEVIFEDGTSITGFRNRQTELFDW